MITWLLVFVILSHNISATETEKCDPTNLKLISVKCPGLLFERIGQPEKNYRCHLTVRALEDLNLSDYVIHVYDETGKIEHISPPKIDIKEYSDVEILREDETIDIPFYHGFHEEGKYALRYGAECNGMYSYINWAGEYIEIVSPFTYHQLETSQRELETLEESSNWALIFGIIGSITGLFGIMITGFSVWVSYKKQS